MLNFRTAGESHGKALIALIEGVPAGLKLDVDEINAELARRQKGYGRGGRMLIEQDRAEILSGIRRGVTLGSPVTILIPNKDERIDSAPDVMVPRPGHADLAGALKYGTRDARDILERASARETAARVAAGSVAKQILARFNTRVFGHVISIGRAFCDCRALGSGDIAAIHASDVSCPDKKAAIRMRAEIDAAAKRKDTIGGVFELIAENVPPGLGSHVQWDSKLDGRIARALLSIQAVKGVEFGAGFASALIPGSRLHDAISKSGKKIVRGSNNAGGIEGGMSNGSDIIVRAAMKPIATLYSPLESVNLVTGKKSPASVERSDICAVPAACVVGEAALAFELARALLEKTGGDSIRECERNLNGYLKQIESLIG